jgi:hypothetical protein
MQMFVLGVAVAYIPALLYIFYGMWRARSEHRAAKSRSSELNEIASAAWARARSEPGAPDCDSTLDSMLHIRRVQQLLNGAARELMRRGEMHDDSALGPVEKPTLDERASSLRALVYGSEEYKKSLAELGPALAHHYARNTHHPEHYPTGIAGMDLFDLVEMLLDWKAASERASHGDIILSIDLGIDRFGVEPQLASILRNTALRHGLVTAP